MVIAQACFQNIFLEDWNKNANGSISSWEMKTLCFYQHPHELINVNKNNPTNNIVINIALIRVLI